MSPTVTSKPLAEPPFGTADQPPPWPAVLRPNGMFWR